MGQRVDGHHDPAVGHQPLAVGPRVTAVDSECVDIRQPIGPLSAVSSKSDPSTDPASETDLASKEDWLRLHATDLLDRLQTWASDLDAREAQLNARLSVQDHRERRFRIHQHDVATELAEQQRSIERLRAENKAQARRLAFQSDSPAE
jgi:hypothetical protein